MAAADVETPSDRAQRVLLVLASVLLVALVGGVLATFPSLLI